MSLLAQPDDESAMRSVTMACEVIGDRWSLPVVAALLDGPLRYTELRQLLPAIAPNILSARLRSLEQSGLVVASRYTARPPRFDYQLTPDGAALADAVRLLGAWAAGRAGAPDAPLHETCGTQLELRWWCPACHEAVHAAAPDAILA